MTLELRYYGDPILRRRAGEVAAFDAELAETADEMVEVMQREEGIGLAAPQVGLDMRVLVALRMKTPDDDEAEPIVMVNPEVLERSRDTWVYEEGCLSIPGIRGDVTRPVSVRVRYQDVRGGEHVLEAEEMFARILQHEIDHLDGKLFVDYLSSAEKMLLKPRLKKLAARLAR